MFWVYENRVAEKNAVVHRAECGHCQNGQGSHPNIHGDGTGGGTAPSTTTPRRERRPSACRTETFAIAPSASSGQSRTHLTGVSSRTPRGRLILEALGVC